MVNTQNLHTFDQEIAALIRSETERQEGGLEMIPSENFVSEAVLEASGSILTNKYAEGLPGQRYYGGCEVVDQIETIAQERAKRLFGAEFVNVQPHSGAGANQAVFEAALQPGDKIMGMKLDHGGHLTHGLKVNFSGKHYEVIAYGVDPTDHLIQYDEVRELAEKNRPKLIICGASAYSRKIDFEQFAQIASDVGALLLADIAHYAGLVVSDLYPTPVPFADFVTTTTHKTLRGPRSGMVMGKSVHEKAVNRAVFPGLQGGPHMHTIAAKAVALKEASEPKFREYSAQVIKNAQTLCEELQKLGLAIVSHGTDSHLFVIDCRPAEITGKDASTVLESIGITANMNTIPYDPQPPRVCSGVRFGTPAITTRGMKEDEMKIIATIISQALQARDDKNQLTHLADQVEELSRSFPLYAHRLVSENDK